MCERGPKLNLGGDNPLEMSLIPTGIDPLKPRYFLRRLFGQGGGNEGNDTNSQTSYPHLCN